MQRADEPMTTEPPLTQARIRVRAGVVEREELTLSRAPYEDLSTLNDDGEHLSGLDSLGRGQS